MEVDEYVNIQAKAVNIIKCSFFVVAELQPMEFRLLRRTGAFYVNPLK